jgi:tetratricopeptide (TPR) repeat protein
MLLSRVEGVTSIAPLLNAQDACTHQSVPSMWRLMWGFPAFRTIRLRTLQTALLLVAVVAVYWPSLRGGFIWDDVLYLRDTPSIHSDDGLRRIWFTTESRDYYPVTYSAYWLEWRFWRGNTLGYRAVNLALHAAGALLLWWLLARLSLDGAWLAALLFAVHPVNVPSVAWICELKNLLAFPLAVLSIIAFQQHERSRRWQFFSVSLLCFMLALLSKPAVVGLPVVILMLIWWRQRELRRVEWLRLGPFFGLAAVFGAVTVWFQTHRALGDEKVLAENFAQRFAGAGWAVWFYLFKAVLPVKLSMLYSSWQFDAAKPIAIVPAQLLIGIVVWLCLRRDSMGGLFSAAICYVALLFPVLGFFDQGYFAYARVADHWQYFALPVVCVVIVSSILRLSSRGRSFAVAALLALCSAFGAVSWHRAHAFVSDEALWRQTISDNPRAWLAHYQFANYQARRGDWHTAIAHYEAAVAINPAFAPAHYNLATALIQQNELTKAATHLEQACRLKPAQLAWEFKLGEVYLHNGQQREARAQFEKVLALKPDHEPARQALKDLDASPSSAKP